MNRNTFLLIFLATGLIVPARAQSSATNIAQPSSAAPVVTSTPVNPADASAATKTPAAAQAPVAPAPASAPSGFTQIVYSPQLPNPADLSNAAATQGLTVERIVQTAS